MIYNYKEIKEKYKNNYKIEKAIKKGEIYKIEKNVYSDTKNVNYLELISKKYPNAIFTMDSAFYFHNLTDVIPSKINLAIERNSSRIKDEKINQVLIIKKLFEICKKKAIIFPLFIRCWSVFHKVPITQLIPTLVNFSLLLFLSIKKHPFCSLLIVLFDFFRF